MDVYDNRALDAPRPRNNRSKVSNGTRLFVEPLDGRTALGRRFKDLNWDFVSDLGGRDLLSEGQRQLIRRASMLSATCEKMEAEAVQETGTFDIERYGMLCDRLGRLLDRLGLERRAKPVRNSVLEHFSKAAE